jgi:hypothetical protein
MTAGTQAGDALTNSFPIAHFSRKDKQRITSR